jgi:hypothetical protein
MSDEHEPLPPLGGLALRALAAERARGDVDAGMHDRLLGRVIASVAVGVAVTGVAVTAHAANATAAATGAATTGAATGTATGAAVTAAGLTAKALPWIIAAFVVGGGVGAAVHAAVAPSYPPSSTETAAPAPSGAARLTSPAPIPAPSSAATDTAAPPAVPVTALPSVPATTARVTTPASPPSASGANAPSAASATPGGTGNDVDLAAERSLVDRARTALGRGQSSDALAALDTHAARYPQGRLSEEREALAVDALARSGRMDLARARAARFRATYPNSVFGGVVDGALAPR